MDTHSAGLPGGGECMKKLIIFLLPVFLTACVRYYTPETAIEDGVYYAEDDPSYVFNSGDYTGVVYYPWSSLDYFYLGYWPYPGYGYRFSYAYPFGVGYSPWYYYDGYYAFHPPWYSSHDYYPYRRPYRGHCPHYGSCGGDSQDSGDDRYADERGNRRRHARDDEDLLEQGNDVGNDRASSASRYVSTAPAGYAGNQGMVIWSRESTKIGQSQIEPVKTTPSKSVIVVPSTPNTSVRSPVTSTRSSFSGGRSRSNSFRSPSRSHSSRGGKSSHRRDRD